MKPLAVMGSFCSGPFGMENPGTWGIPELAIPGDEDSILLDEDSSDWYSNSIPSDSDLFSEDLDDEDSCPLALTLVLAVVVVVVVVLGVAVGGKEVVAEVREEAGVLPVSSAMRSSSTRFTSSFLPNHASVGPGDPRARADELPVRVRVQVVIVVAAPVDEAGLVDVAGEVAVEVEHEAVVACLRSALRDRGLMMKPARIAAAIIGRVIRSQPRELTR